MITSSRKCSKKDIMTPNEIRKSLGLKPIVESNFIQKPSSGYTEPLICKCCGGKINSSSLVCEYCDTKYGFVSIERRK